MKRILHLTSVRPVSSSKEDLLLFQVRGDVDVGPALGLFCAS